MNKSQNEMPTVVAEKAAGGFWLIVTEGYPEMTTGDSRLSGEDVGAFHKWLTGEEHRDYPVDHGDALPIYGIAASRFHEVVDAAIAAGGEVLRQANPSLQPVPSDVCFALESCVKHVLHWNFPENREVQQYQDDEVTGLDKDGCVIQWHGDKGLAVNSGESLEVFGLHNLLEREIARVGVTRDAWAAAVAEQAGKLPKSGAHQSPDHEFKNFHRLLCERFDYVHDEADWKRDQISLIEWIAKRKEAVDHQRDELFNAIKLIAAQSVGDDWTVEQAYVFIKQHAREAREAARVEMSAGQAT